MMLRLSIVWLHLLTFLFVAIFADATERSVDEELPALAVLIVPEQIDGSEIWYGLFKGDITDRSSLLYWLQSRDHNLVLPLNGNRDNLTLVVLKKGSVPNILSLTSELIDQGVSIEFSAGGSVHGHVVSMEGEPIKDASLKVSYPREVRFSMPESTTLDWEVDDEGSFRIDGLPEGSNTVIATALGFMPSKPTEVRIEQKDESLERNFRLARAVHISGRILDTDDSVVAGNVDASFDSEQQLNLELHFDVDGEFRIGPFAENSHVDLTARSPDGRRSEPQRVLAKTDASVELILVDHRTLMRATVSDSETGELIDEFEFRANRNNRRTAIFSKKNAHGQLDVEVDSLSFRFSLHAVGYSTWASNMFSIVGREEFDFGAIELDPLYEVSGRVVDANSKTPIANAQLRRTDGDNYFAGVLNLRTVGIETDDKGEFSFQGLPRSGGTIMAFADGYRSVNHSVTNVEVPLEIELTPESQASIEGTVFSADGFPVVGAEVLLGFGIGEFASGASGTHSDENGAFRFEGWDDGSYTAWAISDIGRSKEQTVKIENGESVSGLRLVIGTLGRIHGEVRGLVSGEEGLVKADGLDASVEGENLSYELIGVSDGIHRVSIVTDGSLSRRLSHSVEIVDGSSERVDFQFGESHTLSGVVTADGRPVVGVYLQAVSPEDRSIVFAYAETLHDGSFSLQGLAEGSYRILLPDFGKTVAVEIVGDTYREIRLGTLSLSGKLVAPETESLLQASVTLTGVVDGNRVRLYRLVGQSGRYSFDGLEKAKYTLTIEHKGFEGLSRDIVLRSSRTDYDLHLTQTSK